MKTIKKLALILSSGYASGDPVRLLATTPPIPLPLNLPRIPPMSKVIGPPITL